MSRLSKKTISLEGVEYSLTDGMVRFKGPKGELEFPLLPSIDVAAKEGSISVQPISNSKQARMNAGTMWALIRNAVKGVREGFTKRLLINGVGYRANMDGEVLVLYLGFANPVYYKPPKRIAITAEKNAVTVSGIDLQLVGQVAAKIRSFRKPEPYKGKGIAYEGEVIRRKAGKKAASTGA